MKSVATSVRVEALANGAWISSPGCHIPLRRMNDSHLVNALLKSLAAGDPEGIVLPLAAEVDRRGLRGMALEVAEKRS
jgi:hypothetical protein